ncbi:Carbohydrate-binding X8 domain superfamily protein isoform 2 [Hibiscus syriacus]|uniref:Carbohydrate-binding X8 domain superfamily protein isoform 2 n=1 Tax=Hibiscus syriacus TaxID=106335 RepID=A0A6A2XF10_HIBSY|nr:glucan endo-1,3-beta-glucosidase 13-like [Hibiscus syriacus]KAE8668300.1 Carbohydrate-binding X8 domain superfamily protein isoform 2 [Hibiscus syriacus]
MTMAALVLKCSLLLMAATGCCCFLVPTTGTSVEEKADAAIPVTTLSPPEGNTTFLDGITWCVARAGVSQIDLQNALDWACGLGMTDCGAIQEAGECYEPDTLVSHASYAFNSYYQQNGNSDISCNFGGTAKHNPSYGKCLYAAPGSVRPSAAPPRFEYKWSFLWVKFVGCLVLLLYKGS